MMGYCAKSQHHPRNADILPKLLDFIIIM